MYLRFKAYDNRGTTVYLIVKLDRFPGCMIFTSVVLHLQAWYGVVWHSTAYLLSSVQKLSFQAEVYQTGSANPIAQYIMVRLAKSDCILGCDMKV